MTAGARQEEGETRLDLVQKNISIFKDIVPEMVKYSPEAIVIVVTNPCDIMAWVAWKLSGLPKHQVFASGTMLDTSRFRQLLAERFNVAAHHVHGYYEHYITASVSKNYMQLRLTGGLFNLQPTTRECIIGFALCVCLSGCQKLIISSLHFAFTWGVWTHSGMSVFLFVRPGQGVSPGLFAHLTDFVTYPLPPPIPIPSPRRRDVRSSLELILVCKLQSTRKQQRSHLISNSTVSSYDCELHLHNL